MSLRDKVNDENIFSFRGSLNRVTQAIVERRGAFVPTGISFVDDALGGGITRGDVVILTAPTGIGKTTLMSRIASNAAILSIPTMVFPLEAERTEAEARVRWLNSDLSVDFDEYFYGSKELVGVPEDLEEKLKDLHFYYGGFNFTVESFCAKIESLKEHIRFAVLDHFHFLHFRGESSEWVQQSSAIRSIMQLAQNTKIPLLIVCHINKNYYKSDSWLPDISDLYGSSALGTVATKVVMLSDRLPQLCAKEELMYSIFIAKHRFGRGRQLYAAVHDFSDLRKPYELFEVATEKPLKKFPRWAKRAKPYSFYL